MTSISTITKTEYTLLQLLRMSLCPSESISPLPSLTEPEWKQIFSLADRHEVLPLLDSVLNDDTLPESLQTAMQRKTAKTVHKSIQLQMLTARLTALLKKADILAVTLKGFAVARYYPVPEFRKTSDIDFYVFSEDALERAVQLLCDNGFHVSEAWHAHHHVVLTSARKEVIELHTAWTEPFKDKHLTRYLEQAERESGQHYSLIDCHGIAVYAYDTAWQAFYLLIHMLLHFVGSGFGLRNLCDWVVLWESCHEEAEREVFWKLVCDSGILEFAKAVTAVCMMYLGLTPEHSPIPQEAVIARDISDALLRDILDAGEFGYGEAERMVGMDGNSITAYVKEFHHQMHINFPQAGNIPVLWPSLWCATLVRFLRNNKRLNRPSISKIMKKAGARGQLVSRLTSPKK